LLRTLGGDGTTYGEHMRGARFTIPSPHALQADPACRTRADFGPEVGADRVEPAEVVCARLPS
jgi:hypothetical protein